MIADVGSLTDVLRCGQHIRCLAAFVVVVECTAKSRHG